MNRLEEKLSEALFQSVENKHSSEDIFDKILKSRDRTNKTNSKGYVYVRRTLRSAAAMLIIFVILITTAFISPSMAEVVRNIPVVGSIFEYMGDNGLKVAEKQGRVSTVYQESQDKNIRITINDVLYDDARIVISFKEECNGEFKNFLNINNDILVNDKLARGFSIGITKRKVSEGIYVGLLMIDIEDSNNIDAEVSSDPKFFLGKLPDEFILGFHINEIEETKGTWNFDIPVSKKASMEMTTKFEPKLTKEYNGTTITLDEVIFAPSCVGLTFSIDPFGESGISTYRVFDDKGKELEVICDSIYEPLYLPINYIPKSLKIVPYTTSSLNTRTALLNKFPITVSQGNIGEITIQKIDFLVDKTLIYYDFKPNDSSVEPNRIKIERKELLIDGGNFLLEGFPDGPTEKLKAPVKVGQYSYVQEYKAIDSNNDLYIQTEKSVDPKPINEFEMIFFPR